VEKDKKLEKEKKEKKEEEKKKEEKIVEEKVVEKVTTSYFPHISAAPNSRFEQPLNIQFNDNSEKTIEMVDNRYNENLIGIKFLLIAEQQVPSKIVNRVLYMTGNAPTFGMFHSSLLIGPWLIDWNESSLCIPKEAKHTNRPFLMLDISDEKYKVKDIAQLQKKLASFIVDWNTKRDYSKLNYNCQHFSEKLIEHIGLDFNFSKHPVYNEFFEHLKKKKEKVK